MSYQVEAINDCTKKLVFKFENVDLKTQIKAALTEKQKTSNMKGFRVGKAPLNLIEQAYGPQIENDALYRFVSEEFYKAIQSEDLKAIGYPQFANTNFEDGKTVSFDATVETFPVFEINDYAKYSFKKEVAAVTDEDITKLTNQYMGPKAEMVEIKDEKATIENGKFAVFNFEGEKPDGTKPDNMKAEEFLLEIGSSQFIPGFEEGLIGLKKGDKKVISLTFPADYHEADLKSADVKFDVEILEIKEKKMPELTDDLAKEFGFESIVDFNTKNKERLTAQKDREVQAKLQEEILNKLIEENKFDIPATLVDSQKKGVQDDLKNNLKQQGFDDSMMETYFSKWQDDITTKAEFQVRSGLILDKIATKYAVEATDSDFDAKIEEMAAQSGMEKDQVATYYKSNEQIKANIMYAIREEKTFEKLISDMKVK